MHRLVPVALYLGLAAFAAPPAPAQDRTVSADAQARETLALTFYQDGHGVIHDRRRVRLPEGRAELRLEGVARTLMPETVLLSAEGARVVEQRFDFDLLTPEALIERSVGERVLVHRAHPETGEDRVEEARILSAREGVVLEIGDRIELLSSLPGRLVFPQLPEGLAPRPRLAALIEAERAGETSLALTYQASGLDWEAEYVGVLDESETRLALTARVALTNKSGLDYEDAAIELVAGALRRVEEPEMQPRMRVQALSAAREDAVTEAPLFGYHLYRLAEPVTLADRQTRRRTLFRAPEVEAEKTYRFNARGFSSWERPRAVDLGLDFANNAESGLGQPMPEGIARIYRSDGESGRLRFLGEDRLGPAPAETDVSLALGEAFDVTVTAEAEDREILVNTRDRQVYEVRQSYRIANAGALAVRVELEQAMPGRDWQILEASHEPEREDADRVLWEVPVPAEGETTLRFAARVEN